ncbi:endothelin-converting enzyme 1 [Xylocopa sonorina]|uniref:endothelin-converting enzyme 1 n=1 Tax=Xylocopa sonorina TaxID=1818115 RepID=UPI00403AB4F6
MPSRYTYQITNVDEGKAAQQDQSYKSCVITLLIFFFLCVILICVGLPLNLYRSHDPDQQSESTKETERPPKSHERYMGYDSATESTKENYTPVTEEGIAELESTSPMVKINKEHVYAGNTLHPLTEEDISNTSASRSNTEASTSTESNRINVTVSSNEYDSDRQTTDRQLASSEVIDEDTPTEASILSSIPKGYGSEDAMNESTTEASTSTKLNRIDVKVFTNESESGRRTTDRQLASSEVIDEDTPTEASILSSITKGYGSEDAMNESTTEASTSTKLNRIDVKVFTNESESGRRTTDRQLTSSEVIDEDTPTEASILSSIPKGYGSEDAMNESTTEASTNKLQQTTVGQLISSEVINEETSTEANILSSTTEKYENEVLTNRSTTEESKRNDSVDTNTTEASTQYPILSTTNDSVTSEPIIPTTTTVPESTTRINNEVCTTGECKNLASKMLFYMNHTTDPCEDFYEYACGGFEANPQVTELTLEDVAYQRILHQMQKENDRSSSFAKYYDSCIQYESTSQTERIQLAKEAISKIGRFFSFDDDWDQNPVNFTDLVAKLLLYNNPLLFDVTPDLDEHSPKQFTLKIGPTTFNNPFDTDEMSDPCHIDQSEKEKEMVDLKELHEEYIKCKSDPVKLAESRTETFSALGICNQTSISFNYTQCIKIINFNIDVELIEYFLAFFPSKDKIREAYLMKNYTLFTIEELQEKFKVINWTQLIKSLTREWIQPNITVQVYFSDALTKGMESLYDFADRFPRNLHNALLGLYANKLYHEFVLSKHEDAKKHCLRVAANVLIQEASNLYISSFSKDQLAYMNRTIHSLFLNLTETLKLSVKKAEWITQDGYNALIAKINSLQIATPYVSNYLSQREANQVNLSSNYFENSMSLMRRYRELMYAELSTNPGNPEQIWTHYATPYQSKGLAIYGLNLIVIPFGAIDWSFKYDEDQFDYITLATAGNVIAHEIAHHFDANGIYYWNGTRDTKNTLFNENDTRDMNFKEYIENQKNTYPDPMNITLPFTGQTVSYEISQLTLNERLSEAMGLRLAYDTLYRLRSSKESSIDLPWLEFHFDRLFYLAYAQMHCTKSPLTSSYVSLYENEYLPSRIRILVSAWSNKLLGEAWSCPQGSRIMPSYSLSAFPYLETN